ncbi:DUF2207 domain-containing protein [Ferruginibacter sp.]
MLCIFVFAANAQKTKPPVYFYTQAAEQYLSDVETDSLLYNTVEQLFANHLVPHELFEQKYPYVKAIVISLSKNGITQSFKTADLQVKKNAPKGTLLYASYKLLYVNAFTKEIKRTFETNRLLKQYLTVDNSDRITFFNSTVRIQKNGKLLVKEEISVHNGNGQTNPLYGNSTLNTEPNNAIKRGIIRAFPVYYTNRYHLFQNTTFELKEVLRDGQRENYHTENHENGILVYTGSSDVYLKEGDYTYTITYETDRQLKSLKDFDELYWNVTGNGWSFAIDSAKCTVILPEGTKALSSKCYTGEEGQSATDCNIIASTIEGSNSIVFRSTKSLPPFNGLTIASSWPKGIVNSVSRWQELKAYIWDNKGVFFLPIAALFSAIFCFIFWFRYGRDPQKGTIYPQFQPPAGFSPAALGYIFNQKFEKQLTAASIVDAGVRNVIKIDVEREGWIIKHNAYNIMGSDKDIKPATSNYEAFESDIEGLIGTSIEKGTYNSTLAGLNTTIQRYCESNYKNKDGRVEKSYRGFFALNSKYTALPILVCLVAAGWGFFGGITKAFMMRNFWQVGYFIIGAILCIVVLRIFSKLLTAYSPEGQQLRDKIEGFRMFLATADEKRFDMMNPPERSLELYEKYLPFAIALGCEIAWGQKFKDIIDSASLDPGSSSSFAHSFTSSSMSNDIGSSFASSFSGAISSASTPPSSSSGGGSSFGGGSSGGGGGGGGGGGW